MHNECNTCSFRWLRLRTVDQEAVPKGTTSTTTFANATNVTSTTVQTDTVSMLTNASVNVYAANAQKERFSMSVRVHASAPTDSTAIAHVNLTLKHVVVNAPSRNQLASQTRYLMSISANANAPTGDEDVHTIKCLI